jgi:hypothetical protein
MIDPFARDWSFLTAELEGAVATVRLNRPDARNALNTGRSAGGPTSPRSY